MRIHHMYITYACAHAIYIYIYIYIYINICIYLQKGLGKQKRKLATPAVSRYIRNKTHVYINICIYTYVHIYKESCDIKGVTIHGATSRRSETRRQYPCRLQPFVILPRPNGNRLSYFSDQTATVCHTSQTFADVLATS